MLLYTQDWPRCKCKLALLYVSSLADGTFTSSRSDDAAAIYLDTNTRIQVLDTVSHLIKADKEQCGAFIVRVQP